MESKAAARLYEQKHKDRPYHDGTFNQWAEKPSRAYPYHYLDGVTITVSTTDYTPDDDWLD
jgi:hypothetical protein